MEEVGTAERRFRSLTSGVYTSNVTARNLLCHLKACNNTLKLAMKFRMGYFKMKAQITKAFQTLVGADSILCRKMHSCNCSFLKGAALIALHKFVFRSADFIMSSSLKFNKFHKIPPDSYSNVLQCLVPKTVSFSGELIG